MFLNELTASSGDENRWTRTLTSILGNRKKSLCKVEAVRRMTHQFDRCSASILLYLSKWMNFWCKMISLSELLSLNLPQTSCKHAEFIVFLTFTVGRFLGRNTPLCFGLFFPDCRRVSIIGHPTTIVQTFLEAPSSNFSRIWWHRSTSTFFSVCQQMRNPMSIQLSQLSMFMQERMYSDVTNA